MANFANDSLILNTYFSSLFRAICYHIMGSNVYPLRNHNFFYASPIPRQLYRCHSLSDYYTLLKNHRALWETCCFDWVMWSEWWGDIPWPTKRQLQGQTKTIIGEHLHKGILDICILWDIWCDEKTWSENKTTMTKTNKIQRQWLRHLENRFKEKCVHWDTRHIFST